MLCLQLRLTEGEPISQQLADRVNAHLKVLKIDGKIEVPVSVKLEKRKDGTLGLILQIGQ